MTDADLRRARPSTNGRTFSWSKVGGARNMLPRAVFDRLEGGYLIFLCRVYDTKAEALAALRRSVAEHEETRK